MGSVNRLFLLTGLAILLTVASPRADDIETLDVVEDISDAWYLNPQQFPVLDRFTSVYSADGLRRGAMLLIFDHRVREKLSEAPFHDLLGFDAGGLKVGFGYRYGLMNNLDIGMYRLNGTVEIFDTYEFDARYQLLRQRKHGLSLAARAGVSWFVQRYFEDASGGFAQLLANKTFAHTLKLGTGLLYHSESSNVDKASSDPAHSLAIPVMYELRWSPSLAIVGEIVSGVDGYYEAHPVVATGLKMITHRHSFCILVSNSQYPAADGIVTGSSRSFSDAAIGFTITRELD